MRLFVSQLLSLPCRQRLGELGFDMTLLPPFSLLPQPVASHADMLFFDLGGSVLMHRAYFEENASLFRGVSLTLSEEPIMPQYPHDILFNALKIDSAVYGLENHLSLHIRSSFTIRNVKQGYAKCSVCALGSEAFITSDPSMARVLERDGKSVLNIQSGHISLPGYDNGFIGGASFVFDHTLYTFGSLAHHPDGKAMTAFAIKHGFTVCPLSDEPLLDVGGALPLHDSLQNERSLL